MFMPIKHCMTQDSNCDAMPYQIIDAIPSYLFMPIKHSVQQLCLAACRKQQCPGNNGQNSVMRLAVRARHPYYVHVSLNVFML